jgi:hypothetical protein
VITNCPPPSPTKEYIKILLAKGLGIVDQLVHDLPALIVMRGGDHKLLPPSPLPPPQGNIKILLAEGLGIVDHLVHDLPALIVVGGGDHKLFHLLELMHAKDASGVAPMGSDLKINTRD